jgi:glycosyltransferase involved in cell wall biosynthesis
VLLDAAQWLVRNGLRGVTFVLLGEDGAPAKQMRALKKQAGERGIEPIVRVIEHCSDLPAALSAADIVVVPAIKPPVFGRPLPEAQAMARPVIASAIGILPETMLAPPRMPDELRTGWLVRPGDAGQLAQAVNEVLALDIVAYRALAARARQFGEFMFSPQAVATALLGVYTSLLEGAAA